MPRIPQPRTRARRSQPHAAGPRQTRDKPVHLGYGYDNCTGSFLEEFSEAQSQKRPPRQHLTIEQLKTLRENADLVESILPAWADNTKFNVAGILRKWMRYVSGTLSPSFR